MVAPSHEHYYWPMKIGRTAWWSSIALLWLMAFPRLRAQTDEIQVYTGEVETPGKANLTIHANYTPSGRTVAEFPENTRQHPQPLRTRGERPARLARLRQAIRR